MLQSLKIEVQNLIGPQLMYIENALNIYMEITAS